MSNEEIEQSQTVTPSNRVRFETLEAGQLTLEAGQLTLEAGQRELRADMARVLRALEGLSGRRGRSPVEGEVPGVVTEAEVDQNTGRTHGVRTPPVNPLHDVNEGFMRQERAPTHMRHGGRVERGDRVAERWVEPRHERRRRETGRAINDYGSSSEEEDRREDRRGYRGGQQFDRPRHQHYDESDYERDRRGNRGLRKPKVDFPRFNGGDPYDWLDKANRYFRICEVTRADKVDIASMYLEGEASSWWRWISAQYDRDQRRMGWTAFEQEIVSQFGPSPVTNHHGQLAKLRQEGKLQTYIKEFRQIQTMTRGWPEELLLGTFTEGLKPWLAREVKLKQPTSLREAMRIAEILDGSYGEKKPFKDYSGSKTTKPLQPENSWKGKTIDEGNSRGKAKEVRRLSREEVQDYIKKGLCFKCGEKWARGHQCPKGKVLMILQSDESDSDTATEEEFSSDEGELRVAKSGVDAGMAELSLNAISGTPRPSTMRLMAWIGSSEVSLLVDSGSSHNFINVNTVKKLGMKGVAIEPFDVKVANGERLKCDEVHKNVKMNVQGVRITAELHVLALAGLDVVLGSAWLKSIGEVVTNYETMTMRFKLGGKKRSWTAISSKEIKPCEAHVMERLCKGGAQCFAIINTSDRQAKGTNEESVEGLEDEMLGLPGEVRELLARHLKVLEVPTSLPPIRDFDHRITLKDESKPVNVPPYRYAYFQKTEIEKQVGEMINNGLIRQSTGPFSSPVLLVRKKDGTWRFCTDYRALNEATVKDRFPIPTVDEMLDELHGASVFTKLDLRAGYHQIRMKEQDVHKTAFRTHSGLYEYLVMPFGLCNAPSTFQATMNEIFRPHLRKFVLVFFDDILVYSRTMEEHLSHLEVVLEILGHHQFYIKMSKCEFVKEELEYLGHFISMNGVRVDPRKIEAMVDWPLPKDVSALRGFLGLTGYYRRFVKHYGLIAKPLTGMLKKDNFEWTEEARLAFEDLKRAMTQTPVLALPNFDKTFEVYTDASGEGIGAVLVQEKRPLAFISKALGPMKKAWSTYAREMLAVIHAVKIWRPYLLGRKFTIVTDQQALRHLLQQKIVTPEQQKFMVKLLGFEYDIIYQPGKENKVADALSRKEGSPMMWTVYGEEDSGLLALSGAEWKIWDKIREAVKLNAKTQEICQKLESHGEGVERYTMKNGLIYYKTCVYVPNVPGLREEILAHFHESKEGGHSGWLRTYVKVKHFFYWEGLKVEVKKKVAECDTCQKVKYDSRRPIGLLQPLPIPGQIWEDLTMDFVEGLPSSQGFEAILVVVDRLSKGAHFIPLKHPFTASSVAKAFVENVVKLHGFPRSIVTDRGKLFMSSFWQELFKLQGSKLKASSSYHPQTDGQTEVVNRTLEQYLRCYCHSEQGRWKEYIPWAEYWYNTTHHAAINMSPFEVIYGRTPPGLSTYEVGTAANDEVEKELMTRDEILAKVKKELEKAQGRMKKYYDQSRREVSFEAGDFVYLKLQPYRQKSLKKKFNVKLSQRYYGPFKVLERIGEVAYRLDLPPTSRLHPVFHVSVLKQRVGSPNLIADDLPSFDEEGRMVLIPKEALQYRSWQRNRPKERVWQVLVHWRGLPKDEATWEDYEEMISRFPEFSLEGKGSLEERGNDENSPRRSTRTRRRKGEVKRIEEEKERK
ncbi:hypothetical protein ACOSQ3_015561 [Xanthoceras sorbifolium]